MAAGGADKRCVPGITGRRCRKPVPEDIDEHLDRLSVIHGTFGVEGAIRISGDDIIRFRVADELRKPVADMNIGETFSSIALRLQRLSPLTAQECDLQKFRTVERAARSERSVRIPLQSSGIREETDARRFRFRERRVFVPGRGIAEIKRKRDTGNDDESGNENAAHGTQYRPEQRREQPECS